MYSWFRLILSSQDWELQWIIYSNYQEQQNQELKAIKKLFNEQHWIEPSASENMIIKTLHVWMFKDIPVLIKWPQIMNLKVIHATYGECCG